MSLFSLIFIIDYYPYFSQFTALKEKLCLPLYETDSKLVLATSNPFNLHLFTFLKDIEIILTPKDYLLQKIQPYHACSLTYIIQEAYKLNASDIHFYSQENNSCSLYFRIHGHLHFFLSLSNFVENVLFSSQNFCHLSSIVLKLYLSTLLC